MLANKQTVKELVYSMADMTGTDLDRRYWCDKAKDKTRRNLCFKFTDTNEADTVAAKLQAELTRQGYDNVVKRTSVANTYTGLYYSTGAEYIRVQALM